MDISIRFYMALVPFPTRSERRCRAVGFVTEAVVALALGLHGRGRSGAVTGGLGRSVDEEIRELKGRWVVCLGRKNRWVRKVLQNRPLDLIKLPS